MRHKDPERMNQIKEFSEKFYQTYYRKPLLKNKTLWENCFCKSETCIGGCSKAFRDAYVMVYSECDDNLGRNALLLRKNHDPKGEETEEDNAF